MGVMPVGPVYSAKALSKAPEVRYQSGAEMAHDLQQCAKQPGT